MSPCPKIQPFRPTAMFELLLCRKSHIHQITIHQIDIETLNGLNNKRKNMMNTIIPTTKDQIFDSFSLRPAILEIQACGILKMQQTNSE